MPREEFIKVPKADLLRVVRRLDLDAPMSTQEFAASLDKLRGAFTPDEIAGGSFEPNAANMDDGRPMHTDEFLVLINAELEDYHDREFAIRCWLEGDWPLALEGTSKDPDLENEPEEPGL
jgi:hypothetical protein